jgi:hypothetical protein
MIISTHICILTPKINEPTEYVQNERYDARREGTNPVGI